MNYGGVADAGPPGGVKREYGAGAGGYGGSAGGGGYEDRDSKRARY